MQEVNEKYRQSVPQLKPIYLIVCFRNPPTVELNAHGFLNTNYEQSALWANTFNGLRNAILCNTASFS